MALTLSNYPTELSKSLLKDAAACTVRECDETSKGNFVAYVDEGNETYDVSLSTSKTGGVNSHACDCGDTAFCRHRAALLLHVAGAAAKPKAKGKKAIAKSKRSEAEQVMDDVDFEALKEWLLSRLSKYKDLELDFIQHFAGAGKQYSPKEAEAITNQAIKAVMGARRKADPSEVKKVVDLWENLHLPVVDYYLNYITDAEAFDTLHALVSSCMEFQQRIQTSTNKILRYVETILRRSAEPLANLATDAAFEKALTPFITHSFHTQQGVRLYYLQHLADVLALCSEAHRNWLVEALVEHYKSVEPQRFHGGYEYTQQLFALSLQYGFFERHYAVFKPIHYNNVFNQTLIDKLIDAGQLSLATKYCRQQINSNTKDTYNLPYLKLLQRIYQLEDNQAGLVAVCEQMVPLTFNYDDYLVVYNSFEDAAEQKNWRTSILNKARRQPYNYDASKFYFRVLYEAGDYKRMLESVTTQTSYAILLKYFEPLFQTNKIKLLQLISMRHGDFIIFRADEGNREPVIRQLAEKLRQHYTKEELHVLAHTNDKNLFYMRPSVFAPYLQDL